MTFVWITKYRKKIITGKIASRLKVLLLQGCSANNIIIIKGNVQSAYVYLLPSLSIAPIMQYLKGRSSKELQEEFSELRKQFWEQYMLATRYFCRTVGTVTNEIIKNYIDE